MEKHGIQHYPQAHGNLPLAVGHQSFWISCDRHLHDLANQIIDQKFKELDSMESATT